MEIEKRPGWDWTVTFQWDDQPEPTVMDVFGAMTIEEALKEARFALDVPPLPNGERFDVGYTIFGIQRRAAAGAPEILCLK